MSVKMASLKIRRSELSVIAITVPQWEVPILEAVHGRVNLEPVSTTLDADALPPNVEEEFERLTKRYGFARNKDGSIGEPHAENVYGKHAAGAMALERAIVAATA